MENNMQKKLLESVGSIYEFAENSKLRNELFDLIDSDLEVLSEYFGINRKQSLLLAVIFMMNSMNSRYDTISLNNLINFFECNPVKILDYVGDLEDLCQKNLLVKKELSNLNSKTFFEKELYSINQETAQLIFGKNPDEELNNKKFNDILSVLEVLCNVSKKRDENEIDYFIFKIKVRIILENNNHLTLIQEINKINISIEEKYMFLYLIWKKLNGIDSIRIEDIADFLFEKSSERIEFIQRVLSDESFLLSNDYIEIVEDNFFNDAEIKLTDFSINRIQELGVKLIYKNKKNNNLIKPEKIKKINLYFNEKEEKQLELVKHIIHENKFREVQEQLEAKSLPKGITVLFHGAAGTGKTETVLQIARETQRAIMKVDISNTKSMWFGESEKRVKRIFTEYSKLVKESECTPILLFNEADAIISKRKENLTSNVAQTENAIQNILLEELENFEGILFATTNLVCNIDYAFDRRFLFKIEFQKPEVAVKAKIWKSKLPILSDADCMTLSTLFDFSGAQIENIARKCEIHEIIYGISVDYDKILEFCKTETFAKNGGARIGFIKT